MLLHRQRRQLRRGDRVTRGRGALHGAPTTYGALFAAFWLGSVIGGVYCTCHPKAGVPRMIRVPLIYAAAMLATALTSQTYAAVAVLIVVGVASITFVPAGNSTVQLAARAWHAGGAPRPRPRHDPPDRPTRAAPKSNRSVQFSRRTGVTTIAYAPRSTRNGATPGR